MAALEVVKSMKQSLGKRQTTSIGHEVEFSFSAPQARKVCIAGRFNDWNMTSMPLKKNADGTWKIKLKLAAGKHEYKFVVDGAWSQDQSCSETELNSFGTYNCIRNVA